MKYTDYGFRPLYRNFCIFPLNDVIREALKEHPGVADADGIMVYGYVDHEAGNTLELIALTKSVDNDKYSFIKITDENRYFLRHASVMSEEFDFVDYGNSNLYEQFKSKVNLLYFYNVSENIEKTRKMSFLDEFRHDRNFDDVRVVLYKEGYELEGVWVRIESYEKGVFMGTLLNDPSQDLGVKNGNVITFIVNEDKNKNKSLVADLTIDRKYTSEELADGKILKDALTAFKDDKNKFKLYSILGILRDSNVVVPYTKKGVDTLESNHKFFYPVFTNAVEMWEYDNDIMKNTVPFIEALGKAKNNQKIEGIVVNAFSDSFVIPRSMFELIENMD